MKYKPASKSTSFIVELTIVILIFAFSSAITLGLFSSAHKLDVKTGDASIAAVHVQSLAETAKSLSSLDEMDRFADPAAWPQYYDHSWNRINSEDDASYAIHAEFTTTTETAGTMTAIVFNAAGISGEEELVFELEIKKYYPAQ